MPMFLGPEMLAAAAKNAAPKDYFIYIISLHEIRLIRHVTNVVLGVITARHS